MGVLPAVPRCEKDAHPLGPIFWALSALTALLLLLVLLLTPWGPAAIDDLLASWASSSPAS